MIHRCGDSLLVTHHCDEPADPMLGGLLLMYDYK